MTTIPPNPVARRAVFYIPGYDPFPARRYRELYRREGAAQAAISGYDLELIPPEDADWRVRARMDGAAVEARFNVLTWSDIVQASMSSGIAATYGQLFRTVWVYLSTGAFLRLSGLRKGPVLAALYPVAMLLLQGIVAALLGWVIYLLLIAVLKAAPGPGWLHTLAAVGAALVVAGRLLRGFKALDGRFFAYYLMHDFAFTAQARGAYPPELETRLTQFADRIAEALDSDADEVLIVGHSSGAHLAISALADLIRAGRVPDNGPMLSLLTLGQVVPMVSFLPDAHRLRADLRLLSETEVLTWVDVSAPGDGCSFALCDPVAVSGVAGPEQRAPLVISAAFTQTLSPARWQALRWRFFRLHFQYLCAFDQPGNYDYFRLTAGPRCLRDHYAGQAPSKSRLNRAANPYTSCAP